MKISIYGVRFSGRDEMIKYAQSGQPKEGLYVGIKEQRFPCFDIHDYVHENRYTCSLVFAFDKHELQQKLNMLEYPLMCKKEDLGPVIRWVRTGHCDGPMEIPQCKEIVVKQQ